MFADKIVLANHTYTFSLSCIVLFGALSIAANSYRQKNKIKRDVVYRDKGEVGRIYLDAEMPGNFTISGLNNEEILMVSRGVFHINDPFSDSIYWYNIEFVDTGKKMMIDYVPDCGLNCMIEEDMLASKGIVIDCLPIKDQDEIMAQHDISEKLYKPTSGKEVVPACMVTSTVTEIELFTVVDGKNEKIELTGTYNAQIFLANYLVKNRYL